MKTRKVSRDALCQRQLVKCMYCCQNCHLTDKNTESNNKTEKIIPFSSKYFVFLSYENGKGTKNVLKFSKFSNFVVLSTNFVILRALGVKKDYWLEKHFQKKWISSQ